jgi:hypothetical protein
MMLHNRSKSKMISPAISLLPRMAVRDTAIILDPLTNHHTRAVAVLVVVLVGFCLRTVPVPITETEYVHARRATLAVHLATAVVVVMVVVVVVVVAAAGVVEGDGLEICVQPAPRMCGVCTVLGIDHSIAPKHLHLFDPTGVSLKLTQ